MYDMYPEWGPAHPNEDSPANWAAPLQESVDRRDNGADVPEDN